VHLTVPLPYFEEFCPESGKNLAETRA